MSLYNTIQTAYTGNGTKDVAMDALQATSRVTKHSLVVQHATTGAVAGVLNLYRGTKFTQPDGTDAIVYDTTAAATITVSGTTLAAESASFEVAANEYWRGVLSGIGASNTAYWCISYGVA